MAIEVIVPGVPSPILVEIGGLIGATGPTGNLGPFVFEVSGGDLLLHYAGSAPNFSINNTGDLILTT